MKIRWFMMPALACGCAMVFAQSAGHDAGVAAQPAPLRLDEVIRLAEERNPETAGAEHAVRALEHRIRPARTLPDPTASVGWAGKATPFATMSGDASSYRGFSISEQFPARGKLRLAGEMARRDVDAAKVDCEAARRRVVLAVRLAYAEYFYLGKAIESEQKSKDLLGKLAQIAETQYRVGKASQQDVLRAQVEISLLMEKLTMLDAQRAQAVADLNTAMQQNPETPLGVPEALQSRPLRYTLDELYALAEAHDTGLARGVATLERGKLAVSLAERQLRPDVNVSYMFQQRTDQSAMNGATVSVSLPLFRNARQREGIAEAAESLASADRMQQNQRTLVRAEVRRNALAAESAERLMTLYSKAIVPQTALELESSMSSYQVGKADFNAVMMSFNAELEYETGYYRQLADREMALARLESLTDEPVTAADAKGAR